MYCVYVLRSKKDKMLYTGSTNDLRARIERHNRGFVGATKGRRPLQLIYFEACIDIKDARRRETYLKTAWGKRYLKNRLKNYLNEY